MSGIGHNYDKTLSALGTEVEEFMSKCEFCGREHADNSFELYATAERRTLEGVESGINGVKRDCKHCQCRIVGDGVKVASHVYCCAHCALLATSVNVKLV
jgi:hypothetical protein